MKIFSETAVNLFQTRLELSLGGLLLKSYPTTQPQTKMANVQKRIFLMPKLLQFQLYTS